MLVLFWLFLLLLLFATFTLFLLAFRLLGSFVTGVSLFGKFRKHLLGVCLVFLDDTHATVLGVDQSLHGLVRLVDLNSEFLEHFFLGLESLWWNSLNFSGFDLSFLGGWFTFLSSWFHEETSELNLSHLDVHANLHQVITCCLELSAQNVLALSDLSLDCIDDTLVWIFNLAP